MILRGWSTPHDLLVAAWAKGYRVLKYSLKLVEFIFWDVIFTFRLDNDRNFYFWDLLLDVVNQRSLNLPWLDLDLIPLLRRLLDSACSLGYLKRVLLLDSGYLIVLDFSFFICYVHSLHNNLTWGLIWLWIQQRQCVWCIVGLWLEFDSFCSHLCLESCILILRFCVRLQEVFQLGLNDLDAAADVLDWGTELWLHGLVERLELGYLLEKCLWSAPVAWWGAAFQQGCASSEI